MAKTYAQLLYESRVREEEERKRKEAEAAYLARQKNAATNNINLNTSGKSYSQLKYEAQKAAEQEQMRNKALGGSSYNANISNNRGGFWGGLGYVGQSFLNGAVRGVEGIVDYTAGGLASIFGGKAGKKWAEELMTDDWYNYNAAAEKFNPGAGWQLAGDVVGGVGQSTFAIGAGLLATLATGGATAPATIAGIGTTLLSSAGVAVSDAAKDPNADRQGLDYTDWVYGTGAGALEAGVEAATGAIGKVAGKVLGKTAGEMGSELAEAITKKAVKNTVTSSVGKDLLKEMAGEGLEEGLSAFLEPYIKQATYDKDAENASLGDIAYSALVGALAGGATSGAVSLTTSSINNADTLKRGSDIAKDSKKTADLLKNAEVISGYESERETGSEVFAAVVKQYEKVKNSLASTGGAAQTNEQKKMLGELDRYVAAAVMQPAIVNAAKGVALNADSYAESLNAFYQKTNAGKTVTAADLTAGLKMDGTSKEFVNSVNRAMRSNTVLREVVVNNTLGRMEMDAQAYVDSIYGDTRISAIATQENINRFVESADADTLSGVNKALGVDVRTATPEIVAAAVKQFRDSGNAAAYEEGYRDVLEAKRLAKDAGGPPRTSVPTLEGSGDVEADTRTGYSDIETLERMLETAEGNSTDTGGTSGRRPLQEGATRFKSGESDIAVIKHGDRYRIYDYKTGKITRSLTVSELRDIVGRMRGGERPAIEVIGRVLDTSSVGDADTFPSRGRLETAEVERIAEERIPKYKKLTETERESVRETVRRAMLNGVSEEDAALFGRIAAKSGMKIVVDTSSVSQGLTPSPRGEGSDAWYDGVNTVYVDADADRSRTFSGLLGHEMWHRMFKAKKAKKLFMKAFGNMSEGERQEIIDQYMADSKKRGLSVSDSVNIANEEVAAAYAENLFNSPDVWEFVLSEEQSLADRVLSFFRGANKKYSFEPGMTKAAKKWLNEYKKLFNEVAAYNKGRSAAENVGASEGVRKIERLGKVVGNDAIEPNTNENGSYGNKNGVSNNVRTTADNKKVVSVNGIEDLAYDEAVKRGDMETAQRMVDEAAKKAGYIRKAYHGSHQRFTVFSHEKSGGLFNFAKEKRIASDYALNGGGNRGGDVVAVDYDGIAWEYDKDLNAYVAIGSVIETDGDVKIGSLPEKYKNAVLNKSEVQSNLINEEGEGKYYLIPKNANTGEFYIKTEKTLDLINDKETAIKVFDDIAKDFKQNKEKYTEDRQYKIGWAIYRIEQEGREGYHRFWEITQQEHYFKAFLDFIVPNLKRAGYDSIYHYDYGHETYVVFDSEQIKSSAAVTYDDNGKVIPLSKRFNLKNPDVRYALKRGGSVDDGSRSALKKVGASDTVRKIERIGRIVESAEGDDGSRAALAGVKAKTANKMKLATAEKMLKEGVDSETVRRESGWFKGYDGKWRFEIDDSKMQVRIPESKYPKVGDIVQHKALFEAYPELKDIYVTVHDIENGRGSYSRTFGDIEISRDLLGKPEELKSVMAHELQHAIQDIEGFARGASLEYWEKRLVEGYDSRQAYVKAEEKELLDRIKQMRLDDANNDTYFVSDMEDLAKMAPDHPRGKIDWDTLEQIEEDSPQWKAFDKQRDALSNLYGESKVFNFLTISNRLKQLKNKGERFAVDLYFDTAGEIEARDVQNRLHLDVTQRKNTRPDIDNPNVVFADGSTVSYFAKTSETDSAKKQLREHLDEINVMDPVAEINYTVVNKEKARSDAEILYEKSGRKIDRQNFGIIELGKKEISESSGYLNEPSEFAAWMTVPRVLKRGKIISGHLDHKGEGFPTITIAAPVVINGKRGNVAVVVKKTGKYRYKIHRILMPDGSRFVYENIKNNAEPTGSDVTSNKASKGPDISSAFENSISQKTENDNSFDKKTSKDFKNSTENDKNVDDGSRSALKKVGASSSEVAAVRKKLTDKGVDPRGVAAVADYFFDTYGGALTRNAMRYRFMEAADVMTAWDSESFDKAYAKIEKIADEIVNNPKDMSGQTEDIKALKSHLRSIRFVVHDADKSDFDVYGGYGEFRKSHMGKLTLANDGAEIDSIYAELQNQYGLSWFPEVNTVSEQLMRMAQISDMDEDAILGSVENVEAEAQAVAQKIVNNMVTALQAEQTAKEKRMSKSQNEAFKKRARAKAEVHAAKAIARAQKRLDAEAAKLRARAETADARAEAKYERATETEKAKLKAEYETDTKFSEADVKKNFESVEATKKVKKARREAIARELWLELQASDDAAVRDSFVLKYAVKLYDEIRRADYDAYDNMTYAERDALKSELEAMMKKVIKSGKATFRSKMESDIKARAKADAEFRGDKLTEIYQSLRKIDDVKRERFLAASSYKSDEFNKTLEALTRIDWRGKFSDNVARGEVKKLLDWYTVDNPMFEGFKDGNETISSEFNEGIRIRLEMLSEGEGRFTNSELGALAEVIEYFSNLVTNYDRVWLDNKWVSGEETVRRFLDINEKQKNKPLPASVRALRNKIFGQQTFGDPLSVMKLADLYEDGLFVTYYSEWQNAEIAAAAEEAKILEEYNEFFSKKGNKDYLKRAMKDTIDLHGVEVRKIDYIEYVMTLKRKQAFEGVEYGGVIVTDKNGNDVQIYPLPMIGDGRGYSAKLEAAVDAEYKRAVKALSKADLEYMKILERGYELTREAKAIGDMQRLGFVSVVDGYYYPIRRAYTEHLSEFDGAAAATDKFSNAGFNKRTKQDSNSALRIGSADDTFHRHVHGISGYVHLSPVMDSFNKVYKLKVLKTKPGIGADVTALMKLRGSTTSLQAAIAQNANTWKNKNGKVVGVEYLQEIMLDTMGRTHSGKGDDFAARLRSGYVTFALGANPKVLLTQISSLFASTSVLSKRSHFLGAFNKTKNVDDYSIVAKLRNGSGTVAKAQGVVENISEKAQFFMKGIEFVDRRVVRRAFAACQAEVARTEGFKIGTEENLKAAGKLLDKVILETQQNSFASSKTGAARRGGAIAKTLQMFKSDAVKGAARVIDAWGEAAYIRKLLDNKDLSDTERKPLEKRLKNAKGNLRKSLSAVAMSSVYMVLIAELFRSFYGKNDEDEEKGDRWLRRGAEFIGNMLGGLPLYGELWNSFTSQFGDIEAMEFSAINDILDTAKKVIDYASDGLQGKNDGKDTAKLLENLIYGVGQIFGVPARNVKNFVYGVLRLVDKNAAYTFDSMFKDMSYAADLEDALEAGDDDLVLTILELAMREKLGSGLSDGAIGELARLAALGESVLPSAISDTVTVNGEERELSGSELKAVRAIYAEAAERVNVFVNSDFYEELSDEQKAAAVRKIYTLYKDLGYDIVLGTERDKKAMMLSKLVSGDALVMWDACTVLEADKDEDGKTVSGSKKEKVIKAIWSLDIPDVQKVLLIAMRGYKISDGDISSVSGYSAQMALYKYIESLEGLTDEERLDLFEASGFEIKGGAAQEPTHSTSSSGGSKRVTKIGRVVSGTMKGTMKGTMIGSMIGKDYSKKIVKLGKIVN